MRLLFISLFCLLITSCASSNLTSSWVDKTYTQMPIKSTLVVAMSDNLRVRRIFEDDMVHDFRKNGVNAISSSQLFPNKLPSKNDIAGYIKDNNTQTVFVAQLVNIEDKNIRYPGNNYGYGNSVSFHSYYNDSYSYIYDDSYTVSYEFVNVEFTLFDTKSHKPIWSTSSESVDPTNMNDIIAELTHILIENLQDNGVVR
ncbi:hypothetical protein GLP30_08395 [Photobacterium phosphoreum]|uniref:DUF4136 domain-containing protein n=1 Tax=Photobacterium phosphoreum TaxID=659 RepID=A0AAW4ZPR4_PHOPO|nr:hypothetical protein [Photobacterium phosphoreum]KJF87472.1 hypothetical protein UB41_06500 [Photobacterium phosphoreum]MCD9469450.1 hypothetical protein [Photobacterium phosphoreum]MCD9475186.1 hypothetical protein [Photobacterium phosphoreum]MCD9479004.1 hypothetical protein [Photobacterium phosphoreum]MCD9481625.1 hypothetical protein [Photobacterium phosphoreum]